MRARAFGAHGEGLVTYLILDDQRRVDVLTVPTTQQPSRTKPHPSDHRCEMGASHRSEA